MTSSSPDSSSAASTQQQQPPQKMREMIILPKGFEPTDQDVVIGRGKKARTHEGNSRLRGLIEFMIPEYSAAGSNKDEKSYIIKEIVTQIRKSSPDGGFVKFDKSKNRWCEVGDFLAREKISQTFRDAMGDAYSSSNPYKRKRRSFEKKHNAIMDIIKHRRGSSPTSVVQSGASSPNSPPSPELSTNSVDVSAMAPLPSVTQSPELNPPHQNPALMDMFKRPGQIGFARRSMMQFGMAPPPPHPATGPMYVKPQMAHMPPIHSMRTPVMPGAMIHQLRRPMPHFGAGIAAPAVGLGAPTMSMPPRRSSMPYNPALMADMTSRQHHMAMVRRTSTPQGF